MAGTVLILNRSGSLLCDSLFILSQEGVSRIWSTCTFTWHRWTICASCVWDGCSREFGILGRIKLESRKLIWINLQQLQTKDAMLCLTWEIDIGNCNHIPKMWYWGHVAAYVVQHVSRFPWYETCVRTKQFMADSKYLTTDVYFPFEVAKVRLPLGLPAGKLKWT